MILHDDVAAWILCPCLFAPDDTRWIPMILPGLEQWQGSSPIARPRLGEPDGADFANWNAISSCWSPQMPYDATSAHMPTRGEAMQPPEKPTQWQCQLDPGWDERLTFFLMLQWHSDQLVQRNSIWGTNPPDLTDLSMSILIIPSIRLLWRVGSFWPVRDIWAICLCISRFASFSI